MVTVVHLHPSEPDPIREGEPWLLVEPFDKDGKFYGTGAIYNASGDWVGYASLPENDVSLEKALAAAQEWAEKYNVPTIYVRSEPEISNA